MKLGKEDVSSIIENTIADCIPDADKEISRTIAMAVATQLCEDTDEIHLQTRGLLVTYTIVVSLIVVASPTIVV